MAATGGQQWEKRMMGSPLRYVKCVLVAAFLACAACGGSAEKSGAAAYPESPQAQSGGYAGQGKSTTSMAPAADAPMSAPVSVSEESANFSDNALAAGGFGPNDASIRASTPPQPPPPPPAPAKPATSATDKKIANVEIEKASNTTPGNAPGNPSGAHSTAASTDVTPHKSDFLIYTAQMTMAVYQVTPGLEAVEQIARDLGGYLSIRNDTSITIRVPRGSFDEAIRRIGLTGDVVHKEISAEDVTDKYVDMESRLRNAKAMRDRLQELLQRAAVKEAIEIQAQLGKVTEEIEVLEGELKLMRDKIAYSSIAVNFAARGNGALRDMPLRLPFPWLQELGLPRLMSLHE
jgi:hypothetical protein